MYIGLSATHTNACWQSTAVKFHLNALQIGFQLRQDIVITNHKMTATRTKQRFASYKAPLHGFYCKHEYCFPAIFSRQLTFNSTIQPWGN